MPSSTSSFERTIPDRPWRGVLLATLAVVTVAVVAWELWSRSAGYGPSLNDTPDLWAQRREAVGPESIVIIGDSRALFGFDLDALEEGLKKRPVQLSLVGSCAYPILEHLADDESFRGTIICGLVPAMWLVPAGPPVQNSMKALTRYRDWSPTQRASHHLGMLLEERVAFLKQEDLTLAMLLQKLPIPNRPAARVPPRLPPYFYSFDRERRARMVEECAQPGPLQERVKTGWIPLFTPPPPPSYIPQEVFLEEVGKAIEARFYNTAAAVKKLRARGGQIVFVRFPVTDELKKLEDAATPRAGPWTRLIEETGAPGIYFEDHPELASFDCPEWSHLSDADSVEFTRRLVPHLQAALAR